MKGSVAMSDERRVTLTNFSKKVGQYVADTKSGAVTLTQRGEAVAVLIDIDEYRRLTEMEEQAEDLYWTVVALRQDIEWARQGRPTVPLAEVERRVHDHD